MQLEHIILSVLSPTFGNLTSLPPLWQRSSPHLIPPGKICKAYHPFPPLKKKGWYALHILPGGKGWERVGRGGMGGVRYASGLLSKPKHTQPFSATKLWSPTFGWGKVAVGYALHTPKVAVGLANRRSNHKQTSV